MDSAEKVFGVILCGRPKVRPPRKLEEVAAVCLRWMCDGRRGPQAAELPLESRDECAERIDLGRRRICKHATGCA
jgi:hypothetical protein